MEQLLDGLMEIYGNGAEAQLPRYRAALDAFRECYGPGPVHLLRAPGRVNLIGEHTDYNHGYVLPVALDRDVLLLARPRGDGQVRLANMERDFADCSFSVSDAIPPARAGDWSNYARGPAQELTRLLGGPVPGFDGLVSAASPFGVPRGAGVSSSSALTVAMAVAFAHFAGWKGSGAEMARLCSDAEWYVGTRGGIMDQFIALLAEGGHALFLDCRPNDDGDFCTRPVPLPAGYRLLVMDSGVRHTNTRNEFNQRVAACRAGVALLRRGLPHITHLRDVENSGWSGLETQLPEEVTVAALRGQNVELGDLPNVPEDARLRVRACCRHVWTENRRVLETLEVLGSGDIRRVGSLLDEAHASAAADYRISTPELDALTNAAREVDGVAGARLTGAGWGGCVISLVPDGQVDEFTTHVGRVYADKTGREATIFPCQAGPGAGLVTVVEL
ncbi:MAG: galactokinase [Caldilineaceae bacterium]|nr:galactokinase [Caldilineaceae bacterium]